MENNLPTEILTNNIKIGSHTIYYHSFHAERPVATAEQNLVRGTKCTIKKAGQLVSEAEVFKSNKDIDNKKLAREYALKKAIRSIPERDVRTAIWNNILNS